MIIIQLTVNGLGGWFALGSTVLAVYLVADMIWRANANERDQRGESND